MKIYKKSSQAQGSVNLKFHQLKSRLRNTKKRIKKINRVCSQTFRAKKKKQSKCIPIDKWINKIWHIYTMDGYSDIKRNEVLINSIIQKSTKILLK